MPIDITVIIPTYKPQDYLKECIRSIAQQTLDKSRFEIIIVLNGCNEPYRQNIQSWLQPYPQMQVRLIQTDTPGVSNARNIGLDHAHGVNICFIDDDDEVSPNYLKSLLIAKTSDGCITVSNVQDYDEKSRTFHDDYITEAYKKFATQGYAPLLQGRSFLSSSCCKMIPLSVIGDRRFDTHFKIGEDSLFMASISNNLKTIKLASAEAVYIRHERVGSSSRSKRSTWEVLKNITKTWKAYIRIYLSDIRNYNLLFFATRLIAVLFSQIKTIF